MILVSATTILSGSTSLITIGLTYDLIDLPINIVDFYQAGYPFFLRSTRVSRFVVFYCTYYLIGWALSFQDLLLLEVYRLVCTHCIAMSIAIFIWFIGFLRFDSTLMYCLDIYLFLIFCIIIMMALTTHILFGFP